MALYVPTDRTVFKQVPPMHFVARYRGYVIETSSKRQISLLHTCFGKTHAVFSANDNRLFTLKMA